MTDDGSPYDDFLREGSMEKALGLFERKNKNGEQPGAGTGAGTGADDAAPESGAGFSGQSGAGLGGKVKNALGKIGEKVGGAPGQENAAETHEESKDLASDGMTFDSDRPVDEHPEASDETRMRELKENDANRRTNARIEGRSAPDSVYAGRTDPETADEVAAKQLKQNEQAAADAEKQRQLSKEKTWAEEQDEAEKQNAENPDGTPETKDAGNPNVQPDSLIADPKQRQEQPPQDSMYQDPKAQDIYRRHAEKFLKAAGETAVENWGEGVSRGWDMAQNIVKMTLTHPSAMSSSSRLIGTALTGLQTASDFADKAAARYGMAADADPELVKDTLRYRLYRRDAKAGENVVGNTFRTISDSLARNGGDMADMSPSQLSAHMRDMQGEKDRLVAALQEPDLKPSDRRLLMGQAQHLQSYMTGIAKQAKSLQAQQNEANRYARVQDLDRRKVAYDTLPSGDPNPWSLVLHEASPKFNLEIDPQTGAPKTREGMNAAAKTIEGMIGRIEADAAMDPNTKAAYIAHLHGLLKQAYSTKERWDETSARTKASDFGSVMQDLAARFPALANDNGKRLRDLYEKGEWPSDGSVTLRALTARFAEMAASEDEKTRNVGNLFLSSLNSYVNSSKLGNRIASYSLNDRNRAINGHVAELKAAQAHLDELAEEAADGTLTQEQAAEKAKYEARIAMERSLIEGLQKGVSDMNIDEGVLNDAYKDLHKVLFRSTRDDVTGARFDVNDPKVQEALARFDSVVRRYEYKYFNRLLDRGAAVRGVLDGQDGGGAPLPPPGGQGGRQVNPRRQRQRKKTPPADGTPDVADMSGYDEGRPLDVGNATVYDRNGNPTLAKVVVDANGKPLLGEDGRLRFVALRGKEGGKRWVEIDGKGAYKGELYERKAPEGEGAGGDADVPPGGEDEASHDDAEREAEQPEGESAGLGGGDRQDDTNVPPEGETVPPEKEKVKKLTRAEQQYQTRMKNVQRSALDESEVLSDEEGAILKEMLDGKLFQFDGRSNELVVPKTPATIESKMSLLADFKNRYQLSDRLNRIVDGYLGRLAEAKKALSGEKSKGDGKREDAGNSIEPNEFFHRSDGRTAENIVDELKDLGVLVDDGKGGLEITMQNDVLRSVRKRMGNIKDSVLKKAIGNVLKEYRKTKRTDDIVPPETDADVPPETPAFDPSPLNDLNGWNLDNADSIAEGLKNMGLGNTDVIRVAVADAADAADAETAKGLAKAALQNHLRSLNIDPDRLEDAQKANLDRLGESLGEHVWNETQTRREQNRKDEEEADSDFDEDAFNKRINELNYGDWNAVKKLYDEARQIKGLDDVSNRLQNTIINEYDSRFQPGSFYATLNMETNTGRNKRDRKDKGKDGDKNKEWPISAEEQTTGRAIAGLMDAWDKGRADRDSGKTEFYSSLAELSNSIAAQLQTLPKGKKNRFGKLIDPKAHGETIAVLNRVKDLFGKEQLGGIFNSVLDQYHTDSASAKQYKEGTNERKTADRLVQEDEAKKDALLGAYSTVENALKDTAYSGLLEPWAVPKKKDENEAETRRENAEVNANRGNARRLEEKAKNKSYDEFIADIKAAKRVSPKRLMNSWGNLIDRLQTDVPTEDSTTRGRVVNGSISAAKTLRDAMYTTEGAVYSKLMDGLSDEQKKAVDDLMAKYGLEPVFGTKPAKEESEPEPAPETGKDQWNQDRMIGVMGEVAGANDPGKRWDALEKILVHLDPEDDDADLSWLKDVDRNLLNDRIMPILRGYFYTTDDDGQLVPNDELRDKVDEDKRYMVDRVMEAYGQKPVFESEEQDETGPNDESNNLEAPETLLNGNLDPFDSKAFDEFREDRRNGAARPYYDFRKRLNAVLDYEGDNFRTDMRDLFNYLASDDASKNDRNLIDAAFMLRQMFYARSKDGYPLMLPSTSQIFSDDEKRVIDGVMDKYGLASVFGTEYREDEPSQETGAGIPEGQSRFFDPKNYSLADPSGGKIGFAATEYGEKVLDKMSDYVATHPNADRTTLSIYQNGLKMFNDSKLESVDRTTRVGDYDKEANHERSYGNKVSPHLNPQTGDVFIPKDLDLPDSMGTVFHELGHKMDWIGISAPRNSEVAKARRVFIESIPKIEDTPVSEALKNFTKAAHDKKREINSEIDRIDEIYRPEIDSKVRDVLRHLGYSESDLSNAMEDIDFAIGLDDVQKLIYRIRNNRSITTPEAVPDESLENARKESEFDTELNRRLDELDRWDTQKSQAIDDIYKESGYKEFITKYDAWAQYADIYDAISGGLLFDTRKIIGGHGRRYYSREDSEWNEMAKSMEIIAQYFSLSVTSPDIFRQLHRDLPEMARALDDYADKLNRYVSMSDEDRRITSRLNPADWM